MSSNHGQIKRDYVGGTLNIGGKEIVDRRANVCGNNGKFKGDVEIKGDLTIGGDIHGACEPIHITQQKMDDASGNLTLSDSGPYCFVENITGVITIGNDCICVNLNCYHLNANGASNAFVVNGFDHVTICNGCIEGASSTAVSVQNSESVKLCGLHFDGADTSERAIWFNTCTNTTVDKCTVKNFLSTMTAVVQYDSCTGLSINTLSITACTKTLAAPVGGGFAILTDLAPKIFSMVNCEDFTTDNVNISYNTANSVQSNNYFVAFGLLDCNNGFVYRTKLNNNILTTGGLNGMAGYALTGSCRNIYTDTMEICHNDLQVACAYGLLGTADFDLGGLAPGSEGGGLILNNANASDNHCAGFISSPIGGSVLCGIVWGFGGVGNEVRNSQACRNIVDDGGVIGNPAEQRICIGMTLLCETYDCVANNNVMGSTNPNNVCAGFHMHMGSLHRCIANGNSGGERGGIGMWREISVPGFPPFEAGNARFIDCDFENNTGYGFLVYNTFGASDGLFNNIHIDNCRFNNNGSSTADAAAIEIPFLDSVCKNVLIKNCQINGTFSGSGNANGINISNATNVTIINTNVYSTTADGPGHGILLNDCLDSKIISSQLHQNQNSGVELTGNITNLVIDDCIAIDNDIGFDFPIGVNATGCMVKDCEAITNASIGFDYEITSPTNLFIGNKGHNNGNNFQFPSLIINLQELDNTTGIYTQLTGSGAVLGSPFTNLSVVVPP